MGKLLKAALAGLLATGLLAGCGANAVETPQTSPTVPTAPYTTEAPVTEPPVETTLPTQPPSPAEEILAAMTLRQKVGQLFIVQPEALTQADVISVTEDFSAMLERYPVGGLILFGKNIISPDQLSAFNADLQNASAIPLFLAVDEEGGTVARLANHRAFDLPRYKSAAVVGSSEDPEAARQMGSTIGAYLAKYGFNLNFAPVADVNTNPDNTVIGNRAFSTSAEIAADMVRAMADGLNSQGIIATFKHFPGHGDTAEDSHIQLAITNRTEDQLRAYEFLPFQNADSNDMVMVGHIAAPAVTGDSLPASMSGTMIGLLKDSLGFDGLVITDSLSMNAITNTYTSAEAAVSALAAGCHILLMPENLPEAFEAVLTALEDGRLTQQWLEETVLKILEFKMLHGILKY